MSWKESQKSVLWACLRMCLHCWLTTSHQCKSQTSAASPSLVPAKAGSSPWNRGPPLEKEGPGSLCPGPEVKISLSTVIHHCLLTSCKWLPTEGHFQISENVLSVDSASCLSHDITEGKSMGKNKGVNIPLKNELINNFLKFLWLITRHALNLIQLKVLSLKVAI